MMRPMTFGNRLAEEAERREISHQASADLIGVSQATFSRWVNGTNLPGSPYFTKLARFLRTNREEVAASIARERSARPAEQRLTDLEGEVRQIRGLLSQIAEHLGIE